MPRHCLTALTADRAKPQAKAYRLNDGDGLTLYVAPSGVKSWQFRYSLQGKQQTATLGKFPPTTLAEARRKADEARRQADDGRHVTVEKRIERAKKAADRENTFGKVAERWVKVRARRDGWTKNYVREVENSLSNHLAKLDALPVTAITPALCSPILAKIERNAPDMERKVRQRLRAILDHAVEEGGLTINPLPIVRRRKLERQHLPAVLDPAGVGEILRSAEAVEVVSRGVKRSHLLAAFTAQRIGEIVPAQWSEFDLDGVEVPTETPARTRVDPDAGNWRIPRDRMKRKDKKRGDHVVPLPPGLLAQLREWRRADGPNAVYVCPAPRADGYVTREAAEKLYRRSLGLVGKHSPHSWRSVFSTWSSDAGKASDAVEAQLDHSTGTTTESSYNRAKRLERRRELMAWHEARLLAARDGAKVVPILRDVAKA